MEEVLAQLAAGAAEISERALFALTDEQLCAGLARITAIVATLDGVRAGIIREAAGRAVPAAAGFTSANVWLRETQKLSPATAKALTELGGTLDTRPALANAVASGQVSTDQARVVGKAVAALTDDAVDASAVDAAEAALLDHARVLGPAALSVAGERILTHVAPDIAEDVLRRRLERAERQARIDRGLTLAVERDLQRTRISGYLTAEGAAIVGAALEPMSKPRAAVGGAHDERTAAQRRADALVEICRAEPGPGEAAPLAPTPSGLAPTTRASASTGMSRPRLTVTVNYDVLAQKLSYGLLDAGQMLTPRSIRRLACDATLIPAVLDTAGQVLDLGRAARTWTGPARHAIIVRDGGCVFPGCDRPAAWCDVHHCTYYREGGRTDRDNGALVCGYHHDLIHHAGWQVRVASDGLPEVIPPAYVDPDRRPLRNHYHRRP